jgi:hypothetical protein
MQLRWLFVLVGLLLASVLGGAALVLAEDVGQFSRVVNQVDQLKQGKAPPLPAKVPNGLANQDEVLTKEQSMAVVHFVDDSTMTISPKSKVTIEDYMYDANKGKTSGTIKVMQGVVETVIPTTEKLQQKDIQIRTTTAIAGIRGTKLVTVAKPEGTIFYVVPEGGVAKPKPSKIRIRLFSPETQPDAPAVRFVSEGLKKNEPLRQILEEGLEARLDPCDLVKATYLLGITTEQMAAEFKAVSAANPELKNICTPCLILKCTVEALRSLKEVEVAEGQYGILLRNLAPIQGDLKPGDLAVVANLVNVGADGQIPNYPPTQQQVDQAKLPQDVNRVSDDLIKSGADPAELNSCKVTLGVTATPGTEAFAYSPAVVGESQNTGTVGGTGIVPPEQQASTFE